MYKMNVHQLVGRLGGGPRKGDENGIIAPKGLAAKATKLYNKWWGAGTVIETSYPVDEDMAIYTLIE